MIFAPRLQRVVPWSAITIALLFTVDFAHSLWLTQQEKSQAEQRVRELNHSINKSQQALSTTPSTITVEKRVILRDQEIKYVERPVESAAAGEPTGGSPPKAAALPKEPMQRIITRRETVPNPEHAQAEQRVRDASIELEAEGIKIKFLNEATWTMIFKVSFLWAFVLSTLLIYRIAASRYIVK